MAVGLAPFRRIVFSFVLVIESFAGTAQTSGLYMTDLNNDGTRQVRLTDSTAGPIAGPVFHWENPTVYYGKRNEIITLDLRTGERAVLFTSDKPVIALRLTTDGKALTFLDNVPSNELRRISAKGVEMSSLQIRSSVENYIWIDDNNLLAIEPGKPNTMHLITLRPFKKMVVARHIGNTLAHDPKTGSFVFVHKLAVDSWSLKTIGSDGNISILAETLPESEVFGLTQSGAPIAYYDGKLHRYNERTSTWTAFDMEIPGTIMSMQISPQGQKLAFWAKTIH